MTIAIDRRSANITVTARPRVNPPAIPIGSTQAQFNGINIRATGSVRLLGSAGDNPAGWELGFIQAQWIETNWVYYRGASNGDGSLFLQRGKPPARPRQGCRDTVGPFTAIWYNTADNGVAAAVAAFPLVLNARFFDQPSDSCQLVEVNGKTGKNNYLREAQFEFHFCTVLAVSEPGGGAFHQLLSFYWNMHWQATFQPGNLTIPTTAPWTITLTKGGNSSAVSGNIQGAVIDKRFKNLITSTTETQNCNAIFAAAEGSVEVAGAAGRRESRVWDNFDVRR